MKADRVPEERIAGLPEIPMGLRPFEPQSKALALAYGEQLSRHLAPLGLTAQLFGSTQLEIAGKGEWEFLIGATDDQWFPLLISLINRFKKIYALRDDFAVFGDMSAGYEIEVIPLRGDALQRNLAVMAYWESDPRRKAAYEAGKWQHAHSRRSYYRWKSDYIAEIVESL